MVDLALKIEVELDEYLRQQARENYRTLTAEVRKRLHESRDRDQAAQAA